LIMQRIEDKQYRNVSDVTKAAGLVSVFAYESGTGAACTGSSVQDQTGCDQITMPRPLNVPPFTPCPPRPISAQDFGFTKSFGIGAQA
jgi:hypothetical protein